MRITFCLALLIASFSFLGSCNSTFAQSTATSSAKDLVNEVQIPGAVDLGGSLIHPASPLYFLKAIREKIEVLVDGNKEAKAMRQVEFAQRRLREINSLVKVKRQDLIPVTAEEYKLHLKNAQSFSDEDAELQIKVGEAVARHMDVLQRVYDMVGNPKAKAAIRAAIEKAQDQNHALIQKLDLASQQKLIRKIADRQAFACKFLIRESTSSGLNDSEKASLTKRVEKCVSEVDKNLKDELLEQRQEKP